jgi:hypothetical protein
MALSGRSFLVPGWILDAYSSGFWQLLSIMMTLSCLSENIILSLAQGLVQRQPNPVFFACRIMDSATERDSKDTYESLVGRLHDALAG